MPTFEYEEKLWKEGKIIAGLDEVGRGCLAGPVVSAAVILNQNAKSKEYLELINDSKAISLCSFCLKMKLFNKKFI